MADLVFRIIFLASGCCVTASNHCDRACGSHFDDHIHEALCPSLKLCHLEDTHWPIPDDGLRCFDCCSIQFNGLRPTVKTHEAIWDATVLRCIFDLTILSQLGGNHKVNRQ